MLGSLIHVSGSSEPEIKRRINIVREAMFTLDQNTWRSSITLETKLRLYNTCILPIFLYGAETWSVTVILSKKIDALDNWCLGFSMSIGQNSSPMMRYVLARGSHFCPTLFAAVVCPSLAICTAPIPRKTITVLYRRAFWVLLMIGDGGLAVPDNPGWERWRLTCDQWTSDWRRRSGVLRTDRHGGNSW